MSCPKIQATNEHSDLSLSLKEMTHVSYIKYAPQRLWFVLMWFRHVNQDPNCCVSLPSIAEVWWTICLWTSQRTIHQYISFHRLSVHMNPGRFCYFKCIEVIEVARCNPLSRLSQDQLAIRYGYTEGLDPASLTAELPFLIDPFFWAMNNLKNSIEFKYMAA